MRVVFQQCTKFSTSCNRAFLARFLKPVMNASPKEHVVKQLLKPVGLNVPPRPNIKYSEGNSWLDLFDGAKTEERIKELEIEFAKSGMYEMATFRKTNGKLFLSPETYWKADKALYFPHLSGRTLSSEDHGNVEDVLRGKTSVIRVFSTQVGDKISREYIKNTELGIDNYENQSCQVIDINFLENKLKSWLFKLSLNNLKSTVPVQRHDNYWLCHREQIPFLMRERLLINNVYSGYIFVVDPNLKIRFMACGPASADEFNKLWKVVGQLSKEKK